MSALYSSALEQATLANVFPVVSILAHGYELLTNSSVVVSTLPDESEPFRRSGFVPVEHGRSGEAAVRSAHFIGLKLILLSYGDEIARLEAARALAQKPRLAGLSQSVRNDLQVRRLLLPKRTTDVSYSHSRQL